MQKVATRDTCVVHMCCVVRLFLLQGDLIRISATPSDMGEACSLCTSVEVLYVHMRVMVMLNYDYLVVKN
jgi:hypothetical protein